MFEISVFLTRSEREEEPKENAEYAGRKTPKVKRTRNRRSRMRNPSFPIMLVRPNDGPNRTGRFHTDASRPKYVEHSFENTKCSIRDITSRDRHLIVQDYIILYSTNAARCKNPNDNMDSWDVSAMMFRFGSGRNRNKTFPTAYNFLTQV